MHCHKRLEETKIHIWIELCTKRQTHIFPNLAKTSWNNKEQAQLQQVKHNKKAITKSNKGPLLPGFPEEKNDQPKITNDQSHSFFAPTQVKKALFEPRVGRFSPFVQIFLHSGDWSTLGSISTLGLERIDFAWSLRFARDHAKSMRSKPWVENPPRADQSPLCKKIWTAGRKTLPYTLGTKILFR